NEFLAGAGLTEDENRRVGRGDLGNRPADRVQSGAGADNRSCVVAHGPYANSLALNIARQKSARATAWATFAPGGRPSGTPAGNRARRRSAADSDWSFRKDFARLT